MHFTGIAQAQEGPVGIYGLSGWGDIDDAFRIARSSGFKIVISIPDKRLLDKADEHGFKVLVAYWLRRDKTLDNTEWQNYLITLKKSVAEWKSHPAVYGWYPVDEPDGQRIAPGKIGELIRAIKSVDESKPIFTVFDDPRSWSQYIQFFDIIAVDPYLRMVSPGVYEETDVVGRWLKSIKRDLDRQNMKKPVWVVLGAFDLKPHNVKNNIRYKKPTAAEFNEMVNIAIKENVSGILVYTFATVGNAEYRSWKLPLNDPLLWDAVRKMPSRFASEIKVKNRVRQQETRN